MGLVGTTWKSLERRWESLTPRQQFITAFFSSWFVLWCLDRIADAIWGDLPPMSLGASVMAFLRDYVFNGVVGGFMVGAILIGFWSNIGALIRKARVFSRPTLLAFVGAFFVAGLIIGLLFLQEWIEVQDYPRIFIPPASATRNADKSTREFADTQPWRLQAMFRENTKIVATQKMRSESRKWIAVTGIVWDASPTANGDTLVTLAGREVRSSMRFGAVWLARVQRVNKGQRLFAVCKIHSVTSDLITFDQCELTAPGRIIPCGLCDVTFSNDPAKQSRGIH